MTVLDEIVAGVLEDLAVREAATPLADVQAAAEAAPPARDPLGAFKAPGLSVIAEVKRSSPSKGSLAEIADPAALARLYEDGGAAAISVLTEARRFSGSLADLAAVRAAVSCPILRKDFVVTDYQVWEARAAGADLVLLIVAALDDADLRRLLALAGDLRLTTLVETHTPDEVRRALDAGAGVIGVNNRNLKTLDVDLAQFERLAGLVPSDHVVVAESGILGIEDARRMASAGADVVLVGEALVKADDPRGTIQELRRLQPLVK